MSNAVDVTGGGWRGVWVVLAVAHGAWACGDDPPSAPAALAPDASLAPDAGAPPELVMPSDAGKIPERTVPGSVLLLPVRGNCVPGETRACQVGGLCSGLATCSADGQAFGACDCGDGAIIGTGIVGARCDADADCLGGALCMRASENLYLGAGGPAGGYCTMSCVDDAECEALDLASSCEPIGPAQSRYCLRLCLSKDPEPGEAKCLDRADVVCRSEAAAGAVPLAVERQIGFCEPRCGSNSDCPAGRVCHVQAGICTGVQSPGILENGSACALDTDCQGRSCEDRIDGVGTCTSNCVLGSLSGCGYAADASPREAACVTPVASAGRFSEGVGDLGFCLEVCDVDADCSRAASEGWVCQPLSPTFAAFIGRAGACSRP